MKMIKHFFQSIGAEIVSKHVSELKEMHRKQNEELSLSGEIVKKTWIYQYNNDMIELKTKWVDFIIDLFRLDKNNLTARDKGHKTDEK